MIDLVSRTDDLAVLANGFAQRVPQVMARVPVELQSSFVLSLRLHQLQVVLASLSAPQILALHRGLLEESSKEQMFQQLVALQKTLQAQPLSNLRNVHQMYRDEQGPDCDRNALANLLGIGPKEFFVVELVRQVLSLDAEGVKSLREVLSLFSAAHLNLLVDLLVLHDFGALEMRALFVDVMIEEPEAFLGGGFGLGLSTGAMDVGQDEEVEEDEELLQAAVRVEIVEQPPKACVYRRNVRPSPEVHVKGADGNNPHLRVAVVALRCDTMAVLDDTSLSGDLDYPVASGGVVTFKKLKIMKTSNQMGDTHVALRFELREHVRGGAADDYRVLHTTQSSPFMVMSHSSQLKKPRELAPAVQEVIPAEGSREGGTRVVVLGANFMDTPALRVRFGRIDVQPVFHGPRTLSCLAPPARATGPVDVAVCNDASKFGAGAPAAYEYVARPDPLATAGAVANAAAPATRVFFDLNRENLGGRAWTTANDGSDLFFGIGHEDVDSLSGSYDFGGQNNMATSADNLNILDSN